MPTYQRAKGRAARRNPHWRDCLAAHVDIRIVASTVKRPPTSCGTQRWGRHAQNIRPPMPTDGSEWWPMGSADLLERLTNVVQGRYDALGIAHMILRSWGRETVFDGPPKYRDPSRLMQTGPYWLLDDSSGAETVVADDIAQELAGDELRGLLDDGAAASAGGTASTPDVLGGQVRAGLFACAAGGGAVILVNPNDERVIERAGGARTGEDGDLLGPWNWGRWHGRRVLETTYVHRGSIWVVGERTARLHIYPERRGGPLIGLRVAGERNGRPSIQACMWREFVEPEPRARMVIAFDPRMPLQPPEPS